MDVDKARTRVFSFQRGVSEIVGWKIRLPLLGGYECVALSMVSALKRRVSFRTGNSTGLQWVSEVNRGKWELMGLKKMFAHGHRFRTGTRSQEKARARNGVVGTNMA